MKELKIDNEFKNLLPPLDVEEYKMLEKNIVEHGFNKNFPIMEWHGYIVDGHNRYNICKKHNIDFVYGSLAYKTKEEVIEWIISIQLGRRNLNPAQRIVIAEKYRYIYEKKAKENRSLNGGDRCSKKYRDLKNSKNIKNYEYKAKLTKSSTPLLEKEKINVRAKLAKIAGVSQDTYAKGKKILDSDNEKLKQDVLSGEKSINAGYKEVTLKKSDDKKINEEKSIVPRKQKSNKIEISEEVRKICEDLKTEKTKEYRDSIWNYKIDIIECMNAMFNRFFPGFVSILNDMDNRVSKEELQECICNAQKIADKMISAIDNAKKTNLKMEGK